MSQLFIPLTNGGACGAAIFTALECIVKFQFSLSGRRVAGERCGLTRPFQQHNTGSAADAGHEEKVRRTYGSRSLG